MKNFFRFIRILLCVNFISLVITSQSSLASDLNKNDYVVGPGDILDIQVWDHADLNRSVEISQNSAFSFPFIGKVHVSNLTVFEIENLLAQKLADGYLVDPQVSISIANYQNQKIFIFGEVRSPGSYILKHHSHLLELISEAGGFTDNRGSTCIVVRPQNKEVKSRPTPIKNAKKDEIIQVDLEKIIYGVANSQPFYLMPGDSIYIGKAENIFVTGEVKNPGKIQWKKGLTVRQAIAIAGGCTGRASIRRVEIIRNEHNAEKKIRPNLADIVLPNDIIKVPESYF